MRTSTLVAALATAVLLVAPVAHVPAASAASAASAPVPLPARPKGLTAPVAAPATIERASAYQPQVMCYPADLPGVVRLRDLVLKTYRVGGPGNISRGCTEGVSEHSEGRAWDWMLDPKDAKQRAAAADFLAWLTAKDGANARRLGIMYVIYNERIWAVYRASEGWRPSSGHRDHVHVSFSWNGARGTTSFWTGKVAPVDLGPCVRFTGAPAVLTSAARTGACVPQAAPVKTTSRPMRLYGSTGANVQDAQKLLGVARTGRFDRATWLAVRSFQQTNELPLTGALDQATWAALSPGDVTKRTTWGYTRSKAAAHGLARSATPLRQPMVGTDVAMLQIALNMKLVLRHGSFGPQTLAAVKALQKSAGLPQTGVVGKAEWQALVAMS